MTRPTGNPRGRPRGAKNKRTEALKTEAAAVAAALQQAIPKAFEGDAHAFLMAIYKDPAKDDVIRLDAAKAAIRYERPALQAIEHTGAGGGPIETVALDETEAARRIAFALTKGAQDKTPTQH